MKPNQIPAILSDGKIFTVTFIKRTDGSLRTMRARRGVTRYLKGGDIPYDPTAHGLMTVYDLERADYRTVPVDNITELRHHGRVERMKPTVQDMSFRTLLEVLKEKP